MGKLIVIEGTDSSGKATQTKLLCEKLTQEGHNVMHIDFPNYKSESSLFVKKYLAGDYGDNADSVDPYVASTFYALDRYDTYKKDIEQFYLDGGILIADRYTTANMVHQASKIRDNKERDKYLDWLCRLEFDIYKIPKPDMVIFLDMPVEYSQQLSENRLNKITGEAEKDIHESDTDHLSHAYESAHYVAEKYGWVKLDCIIGDQLRPIDEISDQIMSLVVAKL